METNKHPLQTACEELAIPCRSYSGRGMYGKECLGIDIDRGALGGTIADLVDHVFGTFDLDKDSDLDAVTAITEALRRMASDSMGMGMIYYFPGIPFTDDRETEDDE